MARPTKYTPEIIQRAFEYINKYAEYGDQIPSVVGMSCELNIAESTLYDWASQEGNEFSEILAQCKTKQQRVLINGGLSNDMNSNIVKLVLGKHGFHDKQDTTQTNIELTHEQWLESLNDE